jgi:hypothetical protein
VASCSTALLQEELGGCGRNPGVDLAGQVVDSVHDDARLIGAQVA